MTKHSFSIKSLLFTTIVAFSLLIGSNVWAFANVFGSFTLADSSTDVVTSNITSTETTATFDFESQTGSYPISPSQFEAINDEYSNLTPEKSGIISLNTDIYSQNKTNYKLEDYTKPIERAGSQKVLMINSYKTDMYYGYQNTTATTLKANSYYQIKLYVYTDNNAIASVYLSGTDFDSIENSKITSINTNNSWKEVVFYISTAMTNSSDVKLQLYIGQKAHGAQTVAKPSSNFVLFDDITITRISGALYASAITQTSEYQTIIELDNSTMIGSGDPGYVNNGSFANGLTGWTEEGSNASGQITHIANLNQAVSINDQQVVLNTHQPTDTINTSGVVLSAKNNGSVSIKSDDIIIKQHQLYRFAIWAKGNLGSTTLSMTMAGTIDDASDEGLKLTQSITALNATQESINGSWGLYEFYVVGNPLFDTTINLSFALSAPADAKGYVALSDIRSYLVTTSQMNAGTSANSEAKTLKMFSTTNTLSFANYSFNLVDIEESLVYPLAPQSWTAANKNNTNSGVVNINQIVWQNGPFKATYRPSKSGLSNYSDNDNVLMLNGASGEYQAYTSDNQTLSANGYAKITFQANLNTMSKAYVVVKNSNGVTLANIELAKANNYQEWKEYSIYLHNYLNEQTINITLALGTANTSVDGAAFFDNVKFDSSLTEEKFNQAVSNSTTFVYDLTKNALDATVSNTDNTPLMWDLETVSNANNATINSEIIDYRNAVSGTTYITKAPGNPEGNTSNKLMVIQANQPVYTAYKSTLTYTFEASTYYKLSVWVKTTELTPDTVTAEDYTDDGRLIVHGASIIVSNIDSSFTCINTQNKDGIDEWKEYTFYIYPTQSTTSNIQLGLGSEGMPSAGCVYFANLTVSSMTEDEYNNEILAYDVEDLPSNVLLASNTPNEDENTSTGGGNGYFDPFAFSTILIAAAVLVAIVGVLVKKVRQNAPKKSAKVSNTYDRLNTLLKDVDRRERKTAINHKIKLLKEELAQSQTFLAEEVSELQKQTESYNTAKEIAKDNPSIELYEPNVKQIQKEIEIQTAKINQIEQDIEILEKEKERIEKQSKNAIKKLDVKNNRKVK